MEVLGILFDGLCGIGLVRIFGGCAVLEMERRELWRGSARLGYLVSWIED